MAIKINIFCCCSVYRTVSCLRDLLLYLAHIPPAVLCRSFTILSLKFNMLYLCLSPLHPHVMVICSEVELTYSFVVLQEERSNSMTIGIADEHIGLVVGRGGRNIADITQVCPCLMVLHGIMYYSYNKLT